MFTYKYYNKNQFILHMRLIIPKYLYHIEQRPPQASAKRIQSSQQQPFSNKSEGEILELPLLFSHHQ